MRPTRIVSHNRRRCAQRRAMASASASPCPLWRARMATASASTALSARFVHHPYETHKTEHQERVRAPCDKGRDGRIMGFLRVSSRGPAPPIWAPYPGPWHGMVGGLVWSGLLRVWARAWMGVGMGDPLAHGAHYSVARYRTDSSFTPTPLVAYTRTHPERRAAESRPRGARAQPGFLASWPLPAPSTGRYSPFRSRNLE